MCLAGGFHQDFEGASSSCGTDSSNGDSLKNRHESPFSALCRAAEQEAYIPDGKEGLLRRKVGNMSFQIALSRRGDT